MVAENSIVRKMVYAVVLSFIVGFILMLLKCSGTLIPQSSIGGKIPSTRGFYNEKSKTFFQPGVQS